MRSMYRLLLHAAVLAALLTFATASIVFGQDREEVVIADKLQPARLEVSVGTVVTWTNKDGERHRVRSRQGPVEFDSGNLEASEQYSVTFVVAGEYPYLDERNDEDAAYFGTIVVRDMQPSNGAALDAATVTLIDESFQPPIIDVAPGSTVTWQNIDGDDDHTVTSSDGVFNSGVLPAGSTFEHTFDAPGTYPYFCAIHAGMMGTIRVVGSASDQIDDVIEPPVPPESAAPLESLLPLGSSVPIDEPVPSDAPVPDEAGDPGAISIVDISFQPSDIEVASGTTVTWTNDDGVPHTATASDGTFDSGVLAPGDTFSQTFDAVGSYDIFCAIHPSMTGTVTVTSADSS